MRLSNLWIPTKTNNNLHNDDWWSSAPIAHRSSHVCLCLCMRWKMLHMTVDIFAKVIITAPIIKFHPVTKKCQHLINAFTWGQAKQCEAKRSKVVHKQQQQKQKRKRHMTKLNGSRMCMHGPMQNFCKSAFNQYMCEYVLLTKVSSYGVGWRIR